jgi:tetratricopeptide (TPR) repeat protein
MTLRRDAYGLPVSTVSPSALQAYDAGVHGLLGWDRSALETFQRAAAADPGLALAEAGAAICLFLEERFEEARAAAERARAAAAGQTDRERSHVAGAAFLVTGKVGEAEQAMREHLARWPRDLVILQRLYFVWFWQGRFPEMLDLTTALTRHSPGNSFMLGLHAFALEQAGRCDEAIRVAHASLAGNPRDAWGVHALAHAVYETGAFASGIRALPPRIHPCTHLGWFRNHLVWHVALMYFGAGDYLRASAMGRAAFERAPSSIPGDLHDSISLLWRLMLTGHDVAARWAPFVQIARQRLGRPGLLYHAVHLGMALAAGGDWAAADRQLGVLRERAGRDATGITGQVAVPLLEGMQAFAGGDWKRTVERIEPLRPRIIQLGGSRAQRDVYHDTLLEACFRAGDMDRAEGLLADRIARRPDHHWSTRRLAA